ncbi:MAG TPA: DinB family protein [Actinomycetes bacterium]|nr:DinB family protein [Actinomycetes bacterium]
MKYEFLVDTYASERLKVLSAWSEFRNEDLPVRPNRTDPRGRSVLEHMVHQCVSEDLWFRNMLGIDVGAPPLPSDETRFGFIKQYAEDSGRRLEKLRLTDDHWWEQATTFFDVTRSRAWVMTRRLTHTSHHRGQQMAMLRMMGRDLHSNYGPTADTGGLMQNHAPTIYAYASLDELLRGEEHGGAKAPLPGSRGSSVTERPRVEVPQHVRTRPYPMPR